MSASHASSVEPTRHPARRRPSRPPSISRLGLLAAVAITTGACGLVRCGGDESEADRALRDAIRAGDEDEARRQLEAGARADAAGALAITPTELVRGEPGDWLASYLKYHQLLWVRFYESERAMCPPEPTTARQGPLPTDFRGAIDETARAARVELARLGTSFEGVTPLHTAAFFCRPAIARLLLEHGADASARDGAGLTPLHWGSCAEVAEVLLDAGADVSARSHSGLTPLHLAVDVHLVRLLRERGAEVEAVDRCGNTPLHFASLVGLDFRTGNESLPRDPTSLDGQPTWVRILVSLLENTAEIANLLAERFDVARALTEAGADASRTNTAGSRPDDVTRLGGKLDD